MNLGHQGISSVLVKWEIREQDRFAAQKLGEVSVHTDISQEISAYAGDFNRRLSSLIQDYPGEAARRLPVGEYAATTFSEPFPRHDLWLFHRQPGKEESSLIYTNDKASSRRPMEMVVSYLLREGLSEQQKEHETRRNEKLLQKILGNGCTGELLAFDHRGITTPVIYKSIPSFLVWDFSKGADGSIFAFLLIIPRNQDLVASAYKIAARKTGLGSEYAGGFVRIYETGSADYLFPARLKTSRIFNEWRSQLGFAEDKLEKWQLKGFPRGKKLGNSRLFSQILPLEKHLAILLLPDPGSYRLPAWLVSLNALALTGILLLIIRGLILGIWPFQTIGSRFLVVFILAVSLPVVLFTTYATAYVFERLKSDENNLEQTLTTSLLDFDAGKEFLENEYVSAFSQMLKDPKISGLLRENQLASGSDILDRVLAIAAAGEIKLPLSGVAIYDLAGNSFFKSSGNLRESEFATLARFYGLPFTINLRKAVAQEEPSLVLPKHRIDERNLAAMQSFRKGNDGLEDEVERFRFRVVRTDVGRGHLSYIYDFITIDGKLRYALMISWLDVDIDGAVLKRTADQLGVKIPQIKVMALKKAGKGVEPMFAADRSISDRQVKTFYRIADSAFGIRSGMLKTVSDGMSVVAYASRHFAGTVIVAGIDHEQKNLANALRVTGFCIMGALGLFFLLISGIITYFRIAKPLKAIKNAFDNVESGNPASLPVSERQDETGVLAREFAGMVTGLEQRRRLASLLSDQAVSAISVASDGTEIKSENFDGVVMISDIRDFTTMSEQNEPQIITSLLNTHFAEMAAIITSFGGRIYKFIGDAIEAVFINDALIKESAAQRSVLASCAMLDKLRQINDRRCSENTFIYRIGIGLAEGELFAGETGSRESRRDYAIIGSAFKNAEKLESLTRRFPEFPLLVAPEVASACGSDWGWLEENIDKIKAHRLNGIENSIAEKIARTLVSSIQIDKPGKQSGFRINKAGDGQKIASYRPFIFLAGVLAIFFPVFSWLVTFWTGDVAARKRQHAIASEYCENTKMKVNVIDSQQVILEQFLDNRSEELAGEFAWNPSGVPADALASAGAKMFADLSGSGIQPSLFAVLHKPGGEDRAQIEPDWELVKYHGPDSQRFVSEELMRQFAQRFYKGWPTTVQLSHFRDQIPLLTGNAVSFMHLFNDLHARVVLIKRFGVEEYFYWQPILMRNNKAFAASGNAFSGDVLRRRPGPDLLIQVGVIMCVIPREHVIKSHLVTLFNILRYEQVEYAIVAKSQPPRFSKGFPDSGKANLATSVIEIPGWYVTTTSIAQSGDQVRLVLAKKLDMPRNHFNYLFLLLLMGLAISVSWAWFKAVYHESGIAQKFAWQLWLGLIAAAVVPLTVVYTVNEWFAIELIELNPSQERVNLVRHFDELERRQFLQEVIQWDKLRSLSVNQELQQAISVADSAGEIERNNLGQMVNHLAAKRDPRTGYTRFNELLLFHTHGWKQAIYPPGSGPRESGDFKRFIDAFVYLLMADLGVPSDSTAQEKPLSGAVKDEMTREAGLEIFRTLFGSDAYFKLVHGLDLPIKAFMATGIGCFKLIPVPAMIRPEMIFFWLFFDNLNTALRETFKVAESNYPVFAESKVMYGALKQPWTGGWDPGVVRFARWALAKKSPLSTRTVFAGKECLVEARIGSHNEVMIMSGLIPEGEILDKIEESRRLFFSLLALSFVAIVLLSLIVAGDITGPIKELTAGVKMVAAENYDYRIKSGRSDELGQILLSFNRMARGLQEKELMGQMVSGAARKVAFDEESLVRAEKGQRLQVTVLYLAVPEFSCFLGSMKPEQMIKDVSRQISVLCRIILDNNGEVDKIIGEKILAYFYCPEGLQKSNEQALMAMRAIRSAERESGLAFPVTIGIHCGEVIAGLLGVGSRRDFTIIGDPVNTAARICARASELPRDRFLVSSSIAESVPANIAIFRAFGEVQLKGKAESVSLCQVLFDR